MRPEWMLRKEIESLPKEVKNRGDATNVIIVFEFENGHFHTISPDDTAIATKMIQEGAGAIGAGDVLAKTAVVQLPQKSTAVPTEIIFKNRQAIGDMLAMTAAVRDFKAAYPTVRVGVRSTAMHIWDNNPNVDLTFTDDKAILDIGPGFGTNRSNAWNINLIDAFRMDMENKLNLQIAKGAVRPDIWLTEEEMKKPPVLDMPYWLITVGGEPGWTCKQYNRWQEVVDMLKDKIQFVQIGAVGQKWPHLNNVIDFIGKTEDRETGIRDLFHLFLHAQGSVGLVSMHMHLMAAFGGPCVVVAGAREPAWFTHYFGHQYLETNGTLPCGEFTACWKCDIKGCKMPVDAEHKVLDLPVPKCIDIIEPEEVANAILRYYRGGRLEFGKKIPNKFFKNIAKEKKTFSVTVKQKTPGEQLDDHFVEHLGFTWGGGSVTDRDWPFIKNVIKENNVQSVLEFGAGLSTLLFGTVVPRVVTYETLPGWIKKIQDKANPERHIFSHWNGVTVVEPEDSPEKFDLAFVDGPSGGGSREFSTKYAAEHADIVIIHDAGRPGEKQWQEMYLKDKFDMTAKGGHRCHLWVRKGTAKAIESPVQVCPTTKTARMITTCRGFGGSERSTIHIMELLQQRGYHVLLSPTGVISGEYKRNIPQGVEISEDISSQTDLAVLYASDTIWNYNKPEYVERMDKLQTGRKVMAVNYQIGGAGTVPWTIGWDLYMFLNSTKEQEFLKVCPGATTRVLAPATNLTKFFEVNVDYGDGLRLIRHSSQGDAKYPDYNNELIATILDIAPHALFYFMPARSDTIDHPQVFKHPKNVPPVNEFLGMGNCFLYHLPPNYQDQGPKVIVEAMAAGLPVIADNRYGARDRVTPDTGWLVNSREGILGVIKEIIETPGILAKKGIAARERAKAEFVMERWADAIIGEEVSPCCARRTA